jgi:hypothetical protein
MQLNSHFLKLPMGPSSGHTKSGAPSEAGRLMPRQVCTGSTCRPELFTILLLECLSLFRFQLH